MIDTGHDTRSVIDMIGITKDPTQKVAQTEATKAQGGETVPIVVLDEKR